MKKHFMILAAAAACFGLLTMTGCEETNPDNGDGTEQTDGNEDGNGENEGDEGDEQEPAAELSIEKVWISEDNSVCLDINCKHEGIVAIGLSGLDSDANIFVDMGMGYTINGKTESEDKTSGTIQIIQDIYGDGSTVYNDSLTYSDLTEDSVTITVSLSDPMTGTPNETEYKCTLAPESATVFTYMEYMEYVMSQMPTE